MVTTSFARRAALLLAALPLARAAHAQDSSATAGAAVDSVDVRRGDTLWGLAATRLGSPFRWTAIHEVNADRVANPHWIYPGQRLRLPGLGAAVGGVPATERPEPAEPTPDANVDAPHESLAWTIKPAIAPTSEPAAGASAATRSAMSPSRDSAARLLVIAAAPYVGSRRELDLAGTLVSAMDLARDGGRNPKRRLLLNDRVALSLPVGHTSGTFVLVRRGPDIAGDPVLVPTALVSVHERAGDFAVGRVVRLFDAAELGDRVLAAGDIDAGPNVPERASPPDARVVWIDGSAELPTIGTALILGAGANDRVSVDDVFELRSPDRRVAGRTLAGSGIARVRVVRVGARTATALVVSQTQPGIAVGVTARAMRAEPSARPAPER